MLFTNFRCDGKPSCRIPVDSNIFGDPCPGTNKYVEVHYTCEPVQTPATTPKALPPWLLDLAATPSTVPAISSTTSTTTTTTTTTTTASTSTATTTTTSTTTSIRTVPNPLHQKTTEEPSNDVIEDDKELQILEEIVDHCPPKNR